MARRVILSQQAPAPIGPYSQAVECNGFLFVSGQIGMDPVSGQLVSGGVAAEAGQVMSNLRAVLRSAGINFSNVIKSSIFLKSMDDFAVVNDIYGKSFGEAPPARETVEVSRLPKDALVEISVIAAL